MHDEGHVKQRAHARTLTDVWYIKLDNSDVCIYKQFTKRLNNNNNRTRHQNNKNKSNKPTKAKHNDNIDNKNNEKKTSARSTTTMIPVTGIKTSKISLRTRETRLQYRQKEQRSPTTTLSTLPTTTLWTLPTTTLTLLPTSAV